MQQTRDRTDFSLAHTVPHINDTLEEDLAVLVELEEQLPEIGSQIRDIRKVYDRGRDKVRRFVRRPQRRALTLRSPLRRNNSWHRSSG